MSACWFMVFSKEFQAKHHRNTFVQSMLIKENSFPGPVPMAPADNRHNWSWGSKNCPVLVFVSWVSFVIKENFPGHGDYMFPMKTGFNPLICWSLSFMLKLHTCWLYESKCLGFALQLSRFLHKSANQTFGEEFTVVRDKLVLEGPARLHFPSS